MPTTERVFQIFKELNQIPRPSHHEERVADYLGMTRGLVPDIFRGQNTVKFVQDEKYSTKSGDFLRFFSYLCHVIDDFACLDLQH